ncbi:unnamed protein product [Alopecurus aequalis]
MAPHCSAVKFPSRAALAAELGAQRWSRAIAKGPPRKIRIVHVEEPKVIKTDARQFRELVQRLTGKPSGRGGGGGNGASSSSSSAEIAASESSSSQASGGSSSDRAVVALAAVKAKVEEEEGDTASAEVEGFAQAFAKVLGGTNDGAGTTVVVKAEVKEEGDAAWTPEEEGFARGFGEAGDTYDAFFHGLDDFLLGAFQEDVCFSL